jgi:monolysocardiolipin acyltransferase
MAREPGRPLITVSNHASTMDDPCLLSAMLPWRFFATEATHGGVRWTLCANDICHQSRLMSDFFLAGKTLPIVRGGGPTQPILSLMVAQLREHGDWLHIFPEGRVRQDGRMNPLKLGLAHVLCGVADASPIVLPFHHRGMEDVLRVKTVVPRVGNHVHVIIGEPIDMADLLLRCRKVRQLSVSKCIIFMPDSRVSCACRMARTSTSSHKRSCSVWLTAWRRCDWRRIRKRRTPNDPSTSCACERAAVCRTCAVLACTLLIVVLAASAASAFRVVRAVTL